MIVGGLSRTLRMSGAGVALVQKVSCEEEAFAGQRVCLELVQQSFASKAHPKHL